MDEKIYNFYQLNAAKGFKLVHLNIRSLPKKMDQLRVILEGSNIDIFTLSETWLHAKIDSQLLQVKGYNLFRQDRLVHNTNKTRGGGLAIYVRNYLDVSVQKEESSSTRDLEAQWVRIIRRDAKNVLLANIYRPPAGKLNQAIKTLDNNLNSLQKVNEETAILGDFNVDYKNQKSPNYKAIKFFERSHAFDQNINTTTRNTKTSSSLLDVAFTSMKFVTAAGTLDSFLSDHQPIFILKKKEKNREKHEQEFEGRSYRNYDRHKFTERVAAHDWGPFYNAHNPNKAWEEMQNIIIQEADNLCPVKKFKIRHTKPCWITNELIEQMKDRDYFYTKSKRTNNEDDWNIAKFHRNQVNSNIRRARADFIKDQLRKNEGNGARFWRTIKQVMPNKKSNETNAKILLSNKHSESIRDCDIAGYMNNFFVNIGNPVSPTDTNTNNTVSLCPSQSVLNNEEDFHIDSISKKEVEALVDKINVSKSSGISLLSSKLLKDSFQALSEKLTHLFNFSIRTAIFPDQWKKALIIPIPKVGDLKKVENYRPISLLPLPGKILEKLVHSQLSTYLEDNELFSNNQFGFRKQRSTSHAISQLLNQIYTNINKTVLTTAVYVDFSKAFNCVQHSTLLNKLTGLHIDQNLIRWIASYLTNREQRTLANNVYSSYLPVPQGVPQGSVLGPLLYIIYANDIVDRIKNCKFTFYADDMVLYSTKNSLIQTSLELQEDLDSLTNWCIYINISKTKIMFFGSKTKINSTTLPELSIDGTPLQRVQTYTYLGMKLDEQLSLETHANSVIKKVANKLYQLTKIRYLVSKKAALLIYKNMILPLMEYGDIFLHSASQKIRKKLQVLQNKALRCALAKDKYTKSDDLHKEGKILKLKNRRHIHILLHMFQLAQMPDFKLWKAHQPTGVRTRSSKKKLISLRKPKNEKYKKSITYQGPKLWNALPGHLQKIESYHEFKTQVKKLFPSKRSEKQEPKRKPKKKTSITGRRC